MQIGLGWLRLPADHFWRMTLRELAAAADGYVEAHGGRTDKAAMVDDLLALTRSVPARSKSIAGDPRAKVLLGN